MKNTIRIIAATLLASLAVLATPINTYTFKFESNYSNDSSCAFDGVNCMVPPYSANINPGLYNDVSATWGEGCPSTQVMVGSVTVYKGGNQWVSVPIWLPAGYVGGTWNIQCDPNTGNVSVNPIGLTPCGGGQ